MALLAVPVMEPTERFPRINEKRAIYLLRLRAIALARRGLRLQLTYAG